MPIDPPTPPHPHNVNIKSESFVHSVHTLLCINLKSKESEGHLVEDNAEKEEDNVEDLVDHHLKKLVRLGQ